MQRNYDYFKQRETLINKRLEKVRDILNTYKQESKKIVGRWNDEDREKFKDWNRYHDIETTLESQLKENYFDYQDYCFEKTDIAVYNFKM